MTAITALKGNMGTNAGQSYKVPYNVIDSLAGSNGERQREKDAKTKEHLIHDPMLIRRTDDCH